MTYYSQIVNLPVGSTPRTCDEQNALYKSAKEENDARVAELSEQAAECHRAHEAFANALAANSSAAECRKALADYESRKACLDDVARYEDEVRKYQKAEQDYRKYESDYNAETQAMRTENARRLAENQRRQMVYQQTKANWSQQYGRYRSYVASVNAQGAALNEAWGRTLQQLPSLRNYNFTRRTTRCNGSSHRCVTQAWKVANLQTVLRGLGNTNPTAPDHLYSYYPTCPTCPSHVANPGAEPSPPTLLGMLAGPPKTSFEQFLRDKRLKVPTRPANENCAPLGSRPTCNPSAPGMPAEPTCTPPEIPPAPVAPTCKKSFAGMGGILVWVALGGAGLYWYAKKK